MWPLLVDQGDVVDSTTLKCLNGWRLLNKDWNVMAKSHLIWLAFKVNVGDCQTSPLMHIKDLLHPCPMSTYDIFFGSIMAMIVGLKAQGLLVAPLHTLPM